MLDFYLGPKSGWVLPKLPKRSRRVQLIPEKLSGSLTTSEFRQLKQRVVEANRAIGYWYEQDGTNVIRMNTGHVSAKVPGTQTFVTRGRPPERDMMSEVTLQTLVQIDIHTRKKVSGDSKVATMGEIELHACVYERRPDVVAVCHVNGNDWIQLVGCFGLELKAFGVEGIDLINSYGVYPFPYMLSTNETGRAMAKALGNGKAVICSGHGAVTVSDKGPEDAVMNIFNLGQVCKMNVLAYMMAGPDYKKYAISDTVIKRFEVIDREMKKRVRATYTPGKNLIVDLIRANAALARTL
jgi:ribulose-5-phosphate 4-epimerase/fuculose-1-phosphate aldolase